MFGSFIENHKELALTSSVFGVTAILIGLVYFGFDRMIKNSEKIEEDLQRLINGIR